MLILCTIKVLPAGASTIDIGLSPHNLLVERRVRIYRSVLLPAVLDRAPVEFEPEVSIPGEEAKRIPRALFDGASIVSGSVAPYQGALSKVFTSFQASRCATYLDSGYQAMAEEFLMPRKAHEKKHSGKFSAAHTPGLSILRCNISRARRAVRRVRQLITACDPTATPAVLENVVAF